MARKSPLEHACLNAGLFAEGASIVRVYDASDVHFDGFRERYTSAPLFTGPPKDALRFALSRSMEVVRLFEGGSTGETCMGDVTIREMVESNPDDVDALLRFAANFSKDELTIDGFTGCYWRLERIRRWRETQVPRSA